MTPSVVVFDLVGVLIDWRPHLAWSDTLREDEISAYLERIDFPALNKRSHLGETFADFAKDIKDETDAARLALYVKNYARCVSHTVPGTWAVLDRLRAQGTPLHAITNWSTDTWPELLKSHPRLTEVFSTIVYSGREKIAKPDPRIYQIFCDRAGLAAQDCLFIDDKPENVAGAQAAGMEAIHFTGADALAQTLTARGLLSPKAAEVSL